MSNVANVRILQLATMRQNFRGYLYVVGFKDV
jgi:hypothetical protein